MAFLNWHPGLSVGVKAFDQEHMKLISLINELHDSMQSGKGKDILGSVLNKLVDYTATHFDREEAEFKRLGYPHLRAHQQQHEKLKQKVGEFRNRLSIGYNGLITIEMLRFLKAWLEQHIQREDKLYGKFMNGKGIF